MRELSGPKVVTIRDKVRYRAAAMKAGAMVRQTIWMRKPFYAITGQ